MDSSFYLFVPTFYGRAVSFRTLRVRRISTSGRFREWISNDGSTSYPTAADRYHLYVSLACPWASRTVIFRKLKGLEDAIGITVDLMERTFSKIDIENGEVTLQVTPFEIVRLEFYLG